ncbi:polyprenol phosphomannose-dependent alpha 1,6 mannosyltransferase MptB [Gordonia sp. (in: high G+C Gram-positive bacteria)]|uniref:polyprenol phosphomannose-dependent alpha 1,6 mannosyltransferase MptB n=1 Tax=Gordonia sp. (in: high G+C Gram-positive bacteria) TaxID=84139 RepID=UPI0016BC7B8C|nr:polyprenol phosphomannose-dependent alpha 1,6 mannosyltransferase MptB [Gordonia sp. (in: high G+C Gram-positive bacteria)]NLG46043.1 polyprenol phosphomannose-dependent alpha 1,6 mannosyltransferase MptB [Gordonia sp. (in: high G+C Gram-positive bacteria)]
MPELPLARRTLDYIGLAKPAVEHDADRIGDFGTTVARMHDDETEVGPLNRLETLRMRRIRLFGTTGSMLILIGSLGTGMLPVLQNPIVGTRILSLPSRMYSTALTISIGGAIMLVVAWMLLGRYAVGRYRVEVAEGRSPARRMTRGQADRTLLMWVAPLVVAPPLLSKDVYSYLAQSAIAFKGLDPYTYSPMRGLGVDHALTLSVPNLWKDTPAPYGPLFLWIGENITAITGENITVAVVLHRLVAIAGVLMIVWALPRLARRCGVSSVAALWLGALNPLLILHLVGGIHNESLMIGMMLVGLEWCFRAIYGHERLRMPDRLMLSRTGWILVAGVAMIAASSMIKVTSMLALGFAGIVLARRWGATLPALRHAPVREWWTRSKRSIGALVASASTMGVIAGLVVVAICLGTGLGFGWMYTLSTGGIVRSWMSMPTLLSVVSGRIGLWLGLGEQTQAILDIARPIGQLLAAVLVVRWLLACLAGRIHPLGGLGIAMATVVVFFPFVQAWYLLWAVIPLAAWATTSWFRVGSMVISGIIAVVVMPTSSDTSPLVVAQGLATGVIMVAVTAAFFFIDSPLRRWLRSRRSRKAQ